jgi:hypothetical protein
MPGCPIIRFEKHKTSASIIGSAGHHLRTITVKNADPERTFENQILLGLETPQAIQKAVMSMTKKLVKRKDNVRCLEVFLGASDEFWDAGGDWTELAKAHKRMLIDEFGEKNIIGLGWHLDEGRPHGWAFIAPITPDGRLAASHWVDGPTKLKQLLTRVQPFYEPLGLSRAREGVRATHIEMHAVHASNAGSKEAKKRLEEELAFRAKNALEVAQKAEKKAQLQQAQLDRLKAKKLIAKEEAKKIISDAKIESEKITLSSKERIEKLDEKLRFREKEVQEKAAENDAKMSFLNTVSSELKAVFRALPEAIFTKLPDALQNQLIKVFELTNFEVMKTAKTAPEIVSKNTSEKRTKTPRINVPKSSV